MNKANYILVTLSILLIPTICLSQSRLYEPVSEHEQNYFNSSKRNIFPDDIRENIAAYSNELIAWVGIVQKYRVFEEEEYWAVEYLLKHQYYDWIEDFVGEGPIKLSPLGEGYYSVIWYFKKSSNLNELLSGVIGDLLITYGVPHDVIEFNLIRLETKYIRHVPKQYVGTSWLPYDRKLLGGNY